MLQALIKAQAKVQQEVSYYIIEAMKNPYVDSKQDALEIMELELDVAKAMGDRQRFAVIATAIYLTSLDTIPVE